jgi:hypothetical protein
MSDEYFNMRQAAKELDVSYRKLVALLDKYHIRRYTDPMDLSHKLIKKADIEDLKPRLTLQPQEVA